MENSMEVPYKTKNRAIIWPRNPLPGTYSEKTILQKDTCTPMFIAAQFATARIWKQPKCPSTDEWIKKMWYIDLMEYYSVIKRKKNWVICGDVEGPRVSQTEWSNSEKQMLHINTYTWSLEKWYRWNCFQGRDEGWMRRFGLSIVNLKRDAVLKTLPN